jgi:dedicator of cytokinesis protein 3
LCPKTHFFSKLFARKYFLNRNIRARYPSQKEWQRKEQLYLKIVDYFERDKQWEHAIPLCKELAHVYEKKVKGNEWPVAGFLFFPRG